MNDTLTRFITTNDRHILPSGLMPPEKLYAGINDLWNKYGQFLFDSPKHFGGWLQAANSRLSGSTPLAYAIGKGNFVDVEDLLGRMAYGIMA